MGDDVPEMDDGPLEIGQEIDGRYRIEQCVGEGGYSMVYRAVQMAVGRSVALKVMKTQTDGVDDEEPARERLDTLIERFRREAQVLSRLKSPATVTLHDFGRVGEHHFYMALEFIDGVSLTARIGERFPPARVVTILEQALESLGEAHDHGIIHRDIKPGNLMLFRHRGKTHRLKILDFGIAKVLRSLDEETLRQITGESTLVGTPRYVAPENATDRDPGPPADLYGLGLVAYELLLGERAVPGGETLEVLDRHLASDFQVHIDRRPRVPEGLRQLVNRMIRKPLSERYTTADAVLADLDGLPTYEDEYAATASMPRPTAADLPDDSSGPPAEPKASRETPAETDSSPLPGDSSTGDFATDQTPVAAATGFPDPSDRGDSGSGSVIVGSSSTDDPSDRPASGNSADDESGTLIVDSTLADDASSSGSAPIRARERPRPAVADSSTTIGGSIREEDAERVDSVDLESAHSRPAVAVALVIAALVALLLALL